MQCARSLFLWQGRSWVRKGLEAYYTFWMETILSKRRILELYANVIEMGDHVYGIKAAAAVHYQSSARRAVA
jgi:monofunctional biosynthetic peptidoglycan transglycosylase